MHIDIVHDTACPWCRIGKHNLRLALAEWDGEPVTVRYWAYMLNPDLPSEGADYRELMASKYPHASLEQLNTGPTLAGAAVGLSFNCDKISRAPNTLLSHRLIALTPETHKEAVVDAIYAAYFEAGQDISRLGVLLDIAERVSLDRVEIQARLESDAMLREVVSEVVQMYESGISGVPYFIFDGKYGVSGAQPPEVFEQVFARIAQERAITP